jgi:hypothetical protein
MRAILLLPVLALAVAGCSNFTNKFDSWFEPEKASRTTSPAAWARPDTSEDQLAYDVSSCRAQASAVIGRDRDIDSDIGRYDRDIGDEVELRTNMDAFGEQRRFQQIVSDCMTALGYGEADAAGAAGVEEAGPVDTVDVPQ